VAVVDVVHSRPTVSAEQIYPFISSDAEAVSTADGAAVSTRSVIDVMSPWNPLQCSDTLAFGGPTGSLVSGSLTSRRSTYVLSGACAATVAQSVGRVTAAVAESGDVGVADAGIRAVGLDVGEYDSACGAGVCVLADVAD
jgi:hypothetical protein